MSVLNHIRRSFPRTFFSSKNTTKSSSSFIQQDEFSTLDHHFAPYKHFDLLTGQDQQIETSLHTLNRSTMSNMSTQPSIIDTSGDNVEFLPKNSKRTLRTITGVFSPIALSMFAISIFMRINIVLAHAGVLETLLQLALCFLILFCTLLSVCSLATNGAIEGGGVYHMISRALGPEFGGAVGVLFFFANVIANGQSVAALVEALVTSFGPGTRTNIFHETHWWRFLYGTIINVLSLITCLLGSSLFSIFAFLILLLVCFVYLMVVISFFIQDPQQVLIPKVNTYAYHNEEILYNKSSLLYGQYTGFSSMTLRGNLYSNYTIDYTNGEGTNFATIFGLLFSSITGLLAGANMSGELKQPSRSIPLGSVTAILFVFFIYVTETLLIASTTDRYLLLNNYLFLPDINIWQPFVIIGIVSAVFSACLSGLIGASRILAALSKDEIFGPLLHWVRSGTTRRGNPMAAVFFSFILVEVILLIGSLNKISRIVTIFFLLAYFAVNLSCLALDLASAPNFRPTFKYFSWHTALIGIIGSMIMCFLVSAVFASIAIGILTGLIAVLHLRDFPRASWGSISQALIFHQVRKYLLLLDPRKEHVKFWRPQILLLVSNPRSAINLIDFVNDMKKGGLFILGHVKIHSISTDSMDRCTEEYPYWISLIDHMKIKAFVDMTSAATIRDGVVQLMRLAGLGGLRPNTVILGFYDETIPEDKLRTRLFYKRRWLRSNLVNQQHESFPSSTSALSSNSLTSLNSDDIYSILHFPELRQKNEEKQLDVYSYVQIIKDALYLNKSVCLARNFSSLEKLDLDSDQQKVFIDIWPVNFIFPETSTQFDVTCLYMLQLATILSMVKSWKSRAILRVFLCLDTLNENAVRTRRNLDELLSQLRIQAQTCVVAWENVTNLLNNSSRINEDPATILIEPQSINSSASTSINSFIDMNDEYIHGINKLIREQCDNTKCLYLYLPRPPRDPTLSQRYIHVLNILSNNLPPIMFVHGVSSVTCTRL